ncbi:hypothetical protein C0581_03760 [Candidatus Parcubacteria bacterium]|nr:MAG: hypothetical protein C0581_03760 [Candidatus Parcubacteria bacterium]
MCQTGPRLAVVPEPRHCKDCGVPFDQAKEACAVCPDREWNDERALEEWPILKKGAEGKEVK